jgi:hypothetical protein
MWIHYLILIAINVTEVLKINLSKYFFHFI